MMRGLSKVMEGKSEEEPKSRGTRGGRTSRMWEGEEGIVSGNA